MKTVNYVNEELAREKVAIARLILTDFCPFFGHLVLKMQIRLNSEVKIAGVTRGSQLLLNPEWVMQTSQSELTATLIHETLHLAFLCFERQGGRTTVVIGQDGVPVPLWNVAHDFAVNQVIDDAITAHGIPKEVADRTRRLTEERCTRPAEWEPPGLIDPKYRDWSAEEIYDDLQNAIKQQKLPVVGSMNDILSDDGSSGVSNGLSDGDYWKIALVEATQVHEAQNGRDTLPYGIRKLVEEITDPKVAWFDALARWVGENGRRADFTYSRPSRRSDSVGEILPGLKKHGVADVTVLWDTSGSMTGRETSIMSEVIGICDDIGMTVRVICCDAEVHSDQSGVSSANEIEVKGGGGSDFCPAFRLLDEEQYGGLVVVFTDGMISVPDAPPVHPQGVLWVLWDHDRDPTDGCWGETLKVRNEKVVQ